jgi:hypothetical protein
MVFLKNRYIFRQNSISKYEKIFTQFISITNDGV